MARCHGLAFRSTTRDECDRALVIVLFKLWRRCVVSTGATIVQDRAAWHKLVTLPPFAIGKPLVRRQGANSGQHRRTGDDTLRNAPPRSRSGKLPSTPTPISSTHKQNHELIPLGGARKRPSNFLPRTGSALHYTPAGGLNEKGSWPSRAGH